MRFMNPRRVREKYIRKQRDNRRPSRCIVTVGDAGEEQRQEEFYPADIYFAQREYAANVQAKIKSRQLRIIA